MTDNSPDWIARGIALLAAFGAVYNAFMSRKREREKVTLELHLRRSGIYDASRDTTVKAPDAPYIVDFGIVNHSAFPVTISEYGFEHAWHRKGPAHVKSAGLPLTVESRKPGQLVWQIPITDIEGLSRVKRGFVKTLTGPTARSSKKDWRQAYRIIKANEWPEDTSETPGTPSISFLRFR